MTRQDFDVDGMIAFFSNRNSNSNSNVSGRDVHAGQATVRPRAKLGGEGGGG